MGDKGEALEALLAAARAWIDADPDPDTRRELQELVRGGQAELIQERFARPMEFGTAGLRGLIGAGPARMNAATVSAVSAGLARQLAADDEFACERGVVVGRDGRRMSPELARVTAEVLAGHGFVVHWFEDPVPTPLAAFAGRHLAAAASVVVTASHNPPEYNGFKVYAQHGAQIVPPQDLLIRAESERAGPARAIVRTPFEDAVRAGRVRPIGDDVGKAYLAALDAQCRLDSSPPAPISAVTTSLHGVGHPWLLAALKRRGFGRLYAVPEQQAPDGEFPTVRFPNPEEEGALDLALALAASKRSDLVLANDPDADRLSVAVRVEAGAGDAGSYRRLSGNEVGVLLADWLLGSRAREGTLPARPLVLTTIVSTSMLGRVAASYDARCEETLTGFKWMWDRAIALADEGAEFIFAFEEALGYCVGPAVRDKDGIGAAQIIMELAAALAADGQTLLDRLDALYTQHGVHATGQVATRLPGLEGRRRLEATMARLRATPPVAIAGRAVVRRRDLLAADDAELPTADVLTWWLDDASRVVLRPSGTEPKLKAYLEARVAVDDACPLPAAKAQAAARLEALETWVREVVTNG